jgi:putative inorganic carbon (hco3(-)) transporter
MMDSIKNYPIAIGLTCLFLAVLCVGVYFNFVYVAAIPLALIVIYLAIFYQEKTFLLIAFLTPLSVNLEEFTDGRIGLFLPTEPILFGLMLLTLMYQLQRPFIQREVWRNPIIIAIGVYLLWLVFSSIMSTHPMVSFKFLLMKLWFIVPVLLFGTVVFQNPANIKRFIWLFTTAMCIAIVYTLVRHAGYQFGEKEGHWVMSPLFKDHTIYGAIVAINFFLVLGLYFHKKHSPLIQVVLIAFFLITSIGLYFSYTRGAWLSVFAAFSRASIYSIQS